MIANKRLSRQDALLSVFATSILGVNFVAIRIGVDEVPPLLLTGLRFLFAAFPAVLFVARPRAPWKLVAAYGLLVGVVQFGLLFVAIHHGMPAGLSALVLQAQVYFTIILALALYGERPTTSQVIGGGVAMIGLLIVGVERAHGTTLLPFGLVIGAALAWASANMISKRIGQISFVSLMVWSSVVSPAPLFLLSLMLEGWDPMRHAFTGPSWRLMGAIAFLAYPTTLLAFGLWSRLLGRNAAATIAPFGLLIPVVGLVSTHLCFGEAISGVELLGGALVLIGVGINLVLPAKLT